MQVANNDEASVNLYIYIHTIRYIELSACMRSLKAFVAIRGGELSRQFVERDIIKAVIESMPSA